MKKILKQILPHLNLITIKKIQKKKRKIKKKKINH